MGRCRKNLEASHGLPTLRGHRAGMQAANSRLSERSEVNPKAARFPGVGSEPCISCLLGEIISM